MKMTRVSKIVLIIVVAAVGVVSLGGYVYYQAFHVTVPNAYAVWWTADLVIEHMEKNQGKWPRSWEELRVTEAQAYKGVSSTNRDGSMIFEVRPRSSLAELQKRVEIDWSADPAQLSAFNFQSNTPPFRAIRLRNGKNTHYEGREPNAMILEYLRSKTGEDSRR